MQLYDLLRAIKFCDGKFLLDETLDHMPSVMILHPSQQKILFSNISIAVRMEAEEDI